MREIAVRGIPRLLALKKSHAMAAPLQFRKEAAVGVRVAISPRRRDRKADEYDIQRACRERRRQAGESAIKRPPMEGISHAKHFAARPGIGRAAEQEIFAADRGDYCDE
jgi:hypothetical protein